MSNKTTTPADENHPHSIYGASGMKRIRNCAGSVNAIKRAKERGDIPQDSSSSFSTEGTQAHDYADQVLTGKMKLEDIPDEFRIHLEGYIALCNKIKSNALEKKGRIYYEAQVPLFYRPEDISTLDFAAVCEEWIQFVDLKYGVGIKVEADSNDQLATYFLSLVAQLEQEMEGELPDDLKVALAIYQPRHHSFDGGADVWVTTLRDLKDMGIDIEADYQKALAIEENPASGDEEDLNPGDWCGDTFCALRNVCGAKRDKFLDPIIDFPLAADEPPVMKMTKETLTPEQIAWICTNGKTTIKFINEITKGETERLTAGGEEHGMKLVGGKLGNRTWVDPVAAETFLKTHLPVEDRYAPRKVITAPQALSKLKGHVEDMSTIAKVKLGLADEATMKKSKTECLIHRPDGKPTLVPSDDKRPALNFTSPDDEFEEGVDSGDAELDALM